MFGISAVEIILLIVIATIMFGPEKIPEFSRKAARVFVYVRDIANNAQTQLRNELGPEYADLDIRDLNPKAFVAKHMQEEIQLIDEAKKDLERASKTIKDTTNLAKQEAKGVESAVKGGSSAALDKPAEAPLLFDVEAT